MAHSSSRLKHEDFCFSKTRIRCHKCHVGLAAVPVHSGQCFLSSLDWEVLPQPGLEISVQQRLTESSKCLSLCCLWKCCWVAERDSNDPMKSWHCGNKGTVEIIWGNLSSASSGCCAQNLRERRQRRTQVTEPCPCSPGAWLHVLLALPAGMLL